MSKRGNFQTNRGSLTPDFRLDGGGGLTLPADESLGICTDCSAKGAIFTETGRCKDCEIKQIAKSLMGGE